MNPSGCVFHPFVRYKVSEAFIESLRNDGVSESTIRAIRSDNTERSDLPASGQGRS